MRWVALGIGAALIGGVFGFIAALTPAPIFLLVSSITVATGVGTGLFIWGLEGV